MVFVTRFVVFVISFAAGLWFIRNAEFMVRTFGQFDWAERWLGAGGSYSAWKLIGVLAIILGFLYAVGQFSVAP